MTEGRWLLREPSAGADGRVFCFPYSGVGASMFGRWPRWIGNYEICPIQLPGRENRIGEPHFGTYEQLAGQLAPWLAPYLDRPFVFFGHCAGALPAFETGLRLAGLADAGLSPRRRLVVSAQVAPHDCPHSRLLDCDDTALIEELTTLTTIRGGEVHPAFIAMSLDILRSDLDACRCYQREQPVSVPMDVSVVHWSDDTEVTGDELGGWQGYAGLVDFEVVSGGHYDFLTAPDELLGVLLRGLGASA